MLFKTFKVQTLLKKYKTIFTLIFLALFTTHIHANIEPAAKTNPLPVANHTTVFRTSELPVANYTIAYDSIGQGEKTVLLLHGLFGSKEQWTTFAKELAKKDYRVIVPTMPNTEFVEADYALNKQVELLHQFVTGLHLKKINIAGNSMGGLTAALYAKQYPDEVATLAFIGAPLGVKSPKLSPADKLLKEGKNPFIPLTKKEFEDEMRLLFVHPPTFSDEKINARIAQYQQNKERDLRIWQVIQQHNAMFNHPFAVKAPTLIIWGDRDDIFDISGAEILQQNIKNSELMIVKDGSHLLFMETPALVAEDYIQFLK